MMHAVSCLIHFECRCCPVCYEAGKGGLCSKHLNEANNFGRMDAANPKTQKRGA